MLLATFAHATPRVLTTENVLQLGDVIAQKRLVDHDPDPARPREGGGRRQGPDRRGGPAGPWLRPEPRRAPVGGAAWAGGDSPPAPVRVRCGHAATTTSLRRSDPDCRTRQGRRRPAPRSGVPARRLRTTPMLSPTPRESPRAPTRDHRPARARQPRPRPGPTPG